MREKETENLFKEIMVENFQNLGKGIAVQVHKVQGSSNKYNPKRSSPRLVKSSSQKSKTKKENLKSCRRKRLITYKGIQVKSISRFLSKNLASQQRVG